MIEVNKINNAIFYWYYSPPNKVLRQQKNLPAHNISRVRVKIEKKMGKNIQMQWLMVIIAIKKDKKILENDNYSFVEASSIFLLRYEFKHKLRESIWFDLFVLTHFVTVYCALFAEIDWLVNDLATALRMSGKVNGCFDMNLFCANVTS